MRHDFYEIAREIDALSEEYDARNLQGIEKWLGYEGADDYFFVKRLPELDEAWKWLVPLKDKGYFKGDRNPRPEEVKDQPGSYAIRLWNVLPYLEKVAEDNRKNPRDEIADALVEIVDDVISYRDAEGKRVDNYRTDWFMTKIIFKLPPDKWEEKHIDFVGTTARSGSGGDLVESDIGGTILPALIENGKRELVLRLLDIALDYRRTGKGGRREIEPVVKKYWLKEALQRHTAAIAKVCGVDAAEISVKKIRRLVAERENRFWNVWITSIEDSAQNQFPDMYECQLVFFVRDVLRNLPPEAVRGTVKRLLGEKPSILRRLGVNCIDTHYDKLKGLFWEWAGNPLDDYELMHEIFVLLKSNCKAFSETEIGQVVEWIEKKQYGEYDTPEEERTGVAYWKKEWLSAVLETGDARVASDYEKYDEVNPAELDHPGFAVWHETGVVRDVSPVEASELAQWSNEDIAKFLREFKGDEDKAGRRGSEEALGDCLSARVRDNPQKFAGDMRPFLDVPQMYQDTIVRAFNTAWEAKKEFSLGGVLEFIEELVGSESFWSEPYGDTRYHYRNWTIGQMAEFLQAGTRHDDHAFDAEYLAEIERILGVLVEKAPSDISGGGRVVDSVLQSPRAKVFDAMILYALRYARLYNRKKRVRWPKTIKTEFTKRLDKAVEPRPDYLLTLTRYLPNLLYLDNDWVLANIERIFPLHDEERWKLAFEGYLGYTGTVYEKLYRQLRQNGHYARALGTSFEEEYTREKLVQHIAVGFLEDWEKVEDSGSLISLLLKKKDPEDLGELVGFLNTIKKGEGRRKLEEKIKGLWGAMANLLEPEQDKKEYQQVLSKLNFWVGIIAEIDDEVKEWVKLTAKYAGVGWNGDILVGHLAEHVEKTPAYVGEIYVEMLSGGTYPDHDHEEIRRVVESVYQSGYREYGNAICNMYGEVGYYFLRDLYQKYAKEGVDVQGFDVFLCHNSEDKAAVKKIGKELEGRGVKVWLGEWELRPGVPWQRALEEQIEEIKSAAVFVGERGIGPWQQIGVEAFLREFVRRGCAVVPVILKKCKRRPRLPVFLRGMGWVDLRKSSLKDGVDRLVWGITGKKEGAIREEMPRK
ncbi:MAG: toll/interleukin-1 receptor domain-containing protein [Planctomycetota bacterium]|jgi:hypothetical protein